MFAVLLMMLRNCWSKFDAHTTLPPPRSKTKEDLFKPLALFRA